MESLPILHIHPNIQLLVLLFFSNFIDLSAYSNKSNCLSVPYEGKGPGHRDQDYSASVKVMEGAQERHTEREH